MRKRTREVDVKLGVEDITQCGYYEWHEEVVPVVNATGFLFQAAAKWVGARRLLNTRTAIVNDDADDQEQELDEEPLLCRATASQSGDYLFAMYQVVSDDRAALSSLPEDAKVNGPIPEPVAVEEGRLAGISHYFWAMPDERLLCTIRLGRSSTGVRPFHRWLRDYLRYQGDEGVVRHWSKDSERRCQVIEAGRSPTEKPKPPRLHGRFNSVQLADMTSLSRVLNTPSSVQSVTFRGNFPQGFWRESTAGLFGRLKQLLPTAPFVGGEVIDARVTVREPTPDGLTRSTVQKLIDEWQTNRKGPDVGFQLPAGMVWLSQRKPVKRKLMLAFRGDGEEQVDVEALLETLRYQLRSTVIDIARQGRRIRQEQEDERAAERAAAEKVGVATAGKEVRVDGT